MTNTQRLARLAALTATLLCVLSAPFALAHHSAALFYAMGDRITLKGEVKRWNFRNPHAILELEVKNAKGVIEHWTCETSAPSSLRRVGWSQDTLKAGETLTLEGVPARDRSKLMRITSITKADGTKVGTTGRTND